MTKAMFDVVGYEASAECCSCEKTQECMVIRTEAFTAPHCQKCTLKEAKKRAKNGTGEAPHAVPIHQNAG